MLDAGGLGRADRPVPVVLTASTTLGAGGMVAAWCANGRPGFRVYPMDDLTPEERVVGYQWVLLHPWTTRSEEDREMFGRVYTARPGRGDEWRETLLRVGGRPTNVALRLYLYADSAEASGSCWRDDDEGAWRSYVQRTPEFRW
jgi:hypothetical protein